MKGVLFNTLSVIIGSLAGLALGRALPKKYTDAIMLALGLSTIFIGVQGSVAGESTLTTVISLVLGAAVGTLLKIDDRINALAARVEKKFSRGGVAQGLVTAFLLWCVGSLTVTGAIEAGINGNNHLLYVKATLDLFSSAMLASSLGLGVLLAAIPLFLFQGALVMAASFIAPYLSDAAIAELSCVGSVIIIGLGFNLVGISKFKTADFLPAILFAPFVYALVSRLPV